MPGVRERILRLYHSFDIPWRKYITLYATPIILVTIFLTFYLSITFTFFTMFPFFIVLYFIPAFGFLTVFLFPLLKGEKRKKEIERYLHLFITRMSVLASTRLPRKEIFRILSEVKEYGALSDEIAKIYHL
ncbi:type II secretion protein F, partial [Euryarchaeota archaeon ex4484_178]